MMNNTPPFNRRKFIRNSLLGMGGIMLAPRLTLADDKSDLTIVKISHYVDPDYTKPAFAQMRDIVVIEASDGTIGIGEGGSKEMIQNCAEMLIGEDPFRIEHLWQKVYRGYFYPSGRERLHAQGGLDMALWDLKAKILKVPVYELLGGLTRDYVPCYSTGFPYKGSLKETAHACIESGFYAFRITGAETKAVFDAHQWLDDIYRNAEQVREGVGENGQWCIDLHARFDTPEAVTICNMIEPLRPVFVEDMIRSENPEIYRVLRSKVNVPIAVGEQYGDKWDINMLIENHLIDHSRVTLPNVGGITEFMKLAALCETNYIGMIPHFTGPIATTAVIHSLLAVSGFVMTEVTNGSPDPVDYLNDDYVNFKNGKMYPNDRPGLGVDFNPKKVTLVNEITERSSYDHPMFKRPDGSYTNW